MISERTLHTVEADRPMAALTPLRIVAAAPWLHAHSSPTPPAAPASAHVVTRPAPVGPRWFARAGVSTRPVLRSLPVLRAVA